MTPSLPALDNSNLWDRTYAILKDKIVRRQFDLDKKLSIPDIAGQLNVSRTPVRDALNRLEAEGLVVTRSKVGTYVVPIDEERVDNAMDTRLMIELWVARKLPECPADRFDAAVLKMKAIVFEAANAYPKQPYLYHENDYNLHFHQEYVHSGGNSANDRFYQAAMNYRLPVTTPEMVDPGEVETAIRQHGEMLEAFSERDSAKLEKLLTEHLVDSKERIIQKIRRNGGTI